MADLNINRLSLDVPGLPPDHGARLASLIAEGLGSTPFQANFSAEQLRIDLQSSSLGLEHLARLIVAEVRRQVG